VGAGCSRTRLNFRPGKLPEKAVSMGEGLGDERKRKIHTQNPHALGGAVEARKRVLCEDRLKIRLAVLSSTQSSTQWG